MKDLDFWEKILSFLEADKPVFCAIVADNSAHSPGTKGAKLGLPETGNPFGTIGGGKMEFEILEKGKKLLASGKNISPQLEFLVHRKIAKEEGKPSGMICSGEQTNLYFGLSKKDVKTVKQIIHALKNQKPALYRIDSTNGFEVKEEPPLFHKPSVRLLKNKEKWVFEEELVNRKRVAIFGGGHCGKALSWIMHGLDYWIEIYDTRPKVGTFLENHYASRKEILTHYEEGGSKVSFPMVTFVVVMTVDQPSDVCALKGILEKPFPYIGIMGSKNKIQKIFHDLIALGYEKEELEKKLWAPIGLPIQSHKPEEIAVSIAAQILQIRNTSFPHLIF